ncbi:hypothetical protein [Methylobacterium indicum]|uniref:Pectate lyase domain-containing protein n=1 Tax=Methylobacterium indicum TaxID=1775910 RepID=A0A8H8WSN1_9HYPH|nr:hypothetical protein [Methylobacterium indicum]BCM83629.1 hypothetical protein mvi_20900 [Methylobacterium indicum]
MPAPISRRPIPSLPLAAAALLGLAAPFAAFLASDARAAQSPVPPDRFLAAAREAADRAPPACAATARTGADGRVTESPLPAMIQGAAAGTTGGLGRRLYTVTRLDDAKASRSRPSPEGTLRWAVEAARQGGGWIAFAPGLTGTLHLEAGLHLPSDTTLDGGCGGITLTAAPRTTQLTLTDARNVIVSGLTFTKDAYDDKADKTGDAIALTDQFDQVAILHNAFHRCGDGCVDIVRKERFASGARATVAFNHFAQHNKVMLIGTLTCYKDAAAEGCADPLAHLGDVMEPRVLVTVAGNVFAGTSQRHPKVVSNAAVHLTNNLFALSPTAYSNGADSAVYGSATGTGGVLVAEGNIFVNPDRAGRIGAGPISVVRASTGGGHEADGVVAAGDNVTVGNIRVVENRPEIARAVPIQAGAVLRVSDKGPEALATCLLRIAGPQGATAAWPQACR